MFQGLLAAGKHLGRGTVSDEVVSKIRRVKFERCGCDGDNDKRVALWEV